jgi:chemotaxis protein CheD
LDGVQSPTADYPRLDPKKMLPRTKDKATRHYFDASFNCPAVKVLANEYYVASEDLMITTVLGSCVAACIRDSSNGIGGMNHFMLPEGDPKSPLSDTMKYGAYAMEVLINEVLKAGGARERLEAKVFGGGAVLSSMQQMNIGERNAEFVMNYLKIENIPVRARDLGATHARRVSYFPADGRAMVRRLISPRSAIIVATREAAVADALNTRTAKRSSIERFKIETLGVT